MIDKLNIITSRHLLDEEGTKHQIGLLKPIYVKENCWSCVFFVEHTKNKKILVNEEVLGIDSMQALQIALKGLRLTLSRLEPKLHWELDESTISDFGIERTVKSGFGEENYLRFCKVLEDEYEKVFAELKEKVNKKLNK